MGKYSLLIFIFLEIINFNYIYSKNTNLVKIYNGLYSLKKSAINLKNLRETSYSFHFLLPTIGRKSIFRMLKSLKEQIEPQDYITIVFDAKDEELIYEKVKKEASDFKCNVKVIFEEKNLGYWGHGIRNKYQDLPGDFILHCDDDDSYTKNAILTMRKICQNKNILYIFRMKNSDGYIWKRPQVEMGNIGTPNGVFPAKYNNLAKWGLFVGGDGSFCKEVCKKINFKNIVFVDCVIYKTRNIK